MSWNVWPHSRLEAAKCVIPFATLYSPTKQTQQLQVVEYDPVPCKACGAALNPYAAVDFNAKVWSCPFCHTRNHFPPHYAGERSAWCDGMAAGSRRIREPLQGEAGGGWGRQRVPGAAAAASGGPQGPADTRAPFGAAALCLPLPPASH